MTGWLTPVELAAELRRSPSTLKTWRRTGTGPRFTRRGTLVLYRREAVEQWLIEAERANTARQPQPTSDPAAGKALLTRSKSAPVVASVATGADAEF